jgi:hypothetical protein
VILAALPLLLASQPVPGFPPEPIRALQGPGEALMMDAPEFAAGPGIRRIWAAPNGAALLAWKEGEVRRWDAAGSSSLKAPGEVSAAAWGAEGASAYGLAFDGVWRAFRIGPGGSWIRDIGMRDSGRFPLIIGRPDADAAVVIGQPVEFDPQSGEVIREERVYIRAGFQGLDEGQSFPRRGSRDGDPFWTPDGLLAIPEAAPKESGGTERRWVLYDPESGSQTLLGSRPATAPRPAHGWAVLESAGAEAAFRGAAVPLKTFWLAEAGSRSVPGLFVESGAEQAEIAASAVWTLRDGVLWRRRLRTVNLQRMRQEMDERDRATALWHAQDAAVALQALSQQSGGSFPAPRAWKEQARPFTRSDATLERFQYTWAGGPIRPGVDPRATPLGFVQGSGGRMWVSLDGFTRWQAA